MVALDRYFETNDKTLFERLFKSINAPHLHHVPLLPQSEKKVLRGADDPHLLAYLFAENDAQPVSDHRFFDETVMFEKIKFPIKIPVASFSEEMGDVCVFILP